jgi:DNA-binding LacI/PurR family transcriptional regulator
MESFVKIWLLQNTRQLSYSWIPDMAITTIELAKLCNVSRRTVDRALHNLPGINTATKQRILKIANEHKYRLDHIASSLSRGRSMSIGVVLYDLQNRYFSQISNIISIEARRQGYFTYIAVSEKNIDTEMQILNNLASRRVDGIILLPITQGDEYVKELKSLEIPVVTIVNRVDGIPYVHVDDFMAGYDSTRYLYEAGYRNICFVSPPLRKKGSLAGRINVSAPDLRLQGFSRFMAEKADLQSTLLIQKDFREKAMEIIWHNHNKEKTAFLCTSDAHALDLFNYLREKNITVPRDAGIMGFDNLDILNLIRPRLTTMSTSIETVGREAISSLFKLMKGESIPDFNYVPYVICPGETA